MDIKSFVRNYHLIVFDISNQNYHITAQTINLEYVLCDSLPIINVTDYINFVLALKNRLVSLISDGSWMINSIKTILITLWTF